MNNKNNTIEDLSKLLVHLKEAGGTMFNLIKRQLGDVKDWPSSLEQITDRLSDLMVGGSFNQAPGQSQERRRAYQEILEVLREERENLQKKKSKKASDQVSILQELEKVLEKYMANAEYKE